MSKFLMMAMCFGMVILNGCTEAKAIKLTEHSGELCEVVTPNHVFKNVPYENIDLNSNRREFSMRKNDGGYFSSRLYEINCTANK